MSDDIKNVLPQNVLLALDTATAGACSAAVDAFDNVPASEERGLPSELLHEIFNYLSFKDCLRVSSTCHMWRRNAYATTTPIVIPQRATFSRKDFPMLATMLDTFRSAPLIFKMIYAHSGNYAHVGRILGTHLARVRFIRLDVADDEIPSYKIEKHLVPVFTSPAPSLRGLAISFDEGTSFSNLGDDWFAGQAPLLRRCSFSHPIKYSSTFRDVTTLEIECFNDDLCKLFLPGNFGRLETLAMHEMDPDMIITSPAPILPSVRNIWLADGRIARSLDIPGRHGANRSNVFAARGYWPSIVRFWTFQDIVSMEVNYSDACRLQDATGRYFIFTQVYHDPDVKPIVLSVTQWAFTYGTPQINLSRVTHLTVFLYFTNTKDIIESAHLPVLERLTIVGTDTIGTITIQGLVDFLGRITVGALQTLRVEVRGASLKDADGNDARIIPGILHAVDVDEAVVPVEPSWHDPHRDGALIFTDELYL